MKCTSVPAQFEAVHAANGDPLLLYGSDGANLFLWPCPAICKHPIAFGRWSKINVERFRGLKVTAFHMLSKDTIRWAEWLGVKCISEGPLHWEGRI